MTVGDITDDSITFRWNPPMNLNGDSNYRVYQVSFTLSLCFLHKGYTVLSAYATGQVAINPCSTHAQALPDHWMTCWPAGSLPLVAHMITITGQLAVIMQRCPRDTAHFFGRMS